METLKTCVVTSGCCTTAIWIKSYNKTEASKTSNNSDNTVYASVIGTFGNRKRWRLVGSCHLAARAAATAPGRLCDAPGLSIASFTATVMTGQTTADGFRHSDAAIVHINARIAIWRRTPFAIINDLTVDLQPSRHRNLFFNSPVVNMLS